MKCPKCYTENDPDANYCEHCGRRIIAARQHSPLVFLYGVSMSDLLLFGTITGLFILNLCQAGMSLLNFTLSWQITNYISGALWILMNLLLFLPVLAIQNKSIKTVAIILATVYTVVAIIGNIKFIISTSFWN